MPNVLVVGATGYIGTALTSELTRSGDHRVFGLARSPAKATELEKNEVTPVIGNIDSPELVAAIERFQIDIVVDVASANLESRTLLNNLKAYSASRSAKALSQNIHIPKLGFIYCSGTWVHGSSHLPTNDLSPVGMPSPSHTPVPLVAWRHALEKEILAATPVLNTMIIRPALVYGRSSAIWTVLFAPLLTATPNIGADPEARPGLVHVDDVAAAFSCAVNRLESVAGTGMYPVFDLCTSQESMRDIVEAAGRELGVEKEVRLIGCGEDDFLKAVSTSFNGESGRARRILGWTPRRTGFVSGMEVFVKSWKACLH